MLVAKVKAVEQWVACKKCHQWIVIPIQKDPQKIVCNECRNLGCYPVNIFTGEETVLPEEVIVRKDISKELT